jgi:cephalosporin-C deacetylase-like acetyl esterase
VTPASIVVRFVTAACAAAAFAAGQGAAPASLFDYAASRPVDVKDVSSTVKDGATVREITYEKAAGGRNAATLVVPVAGMRAPHPAILFVHWYEPPNPTSNRTEFLDDAVELAKLGTVSLLMDTPWSNPEWFPKRDGEKDYDTSVAQVKEIRRAIDVLVQQPDVDRRRVACVGHDFGAMFGALAVAVDPRPTHFVFMAGTASFTDWYLFTPKREGEARAQFIAKLAPLDPVKFVGQIAPRPVLFQFATNDKFVSKEAAGKLANAAGEPKTVKYYDAQHALNADATRDRQAWLKQELRINVK